MSKVCQRWFECLDEAALISFYLLVFPLSGLHDQPGCCSNLQDKESPTTTERKSTEGHFREEGQLLVSCFCRLRWSVTSACEIWRWSWGRMWKKGWKTAECCSDGARHGLLTLWNYSLDILVPYLKLSECEQLKHLAHLRKRRGQLNATSCKSSVTSFITGSDSKGKLALHSPSAAHLARVRHAKECRKIYFYTLNSSYLYMN